MGEQCEWKQDENGLWETECGNVFEITDGTPHENEMCYCPYCGKTLVHIDTKEKGRVMRKRNL